MRSVLRPLAATLMLALWITCLCGTARAHGQQAIVDHRDLAAMIRVKADGVPDEIGTAIIVSQSASQTILVTAAHVIQTNPKVARLNQIEVAFRNHPTRYVGVVPPDKVSPRNGGLDLAVIVVNAKVPQILDRRLAAVLPGAGETAFAGQGAKIIGFMEQREWNQSETMEAIKLVTADRLELPSVYVAQGASGGPIFSEHGTLLGMVQQDGGALAVGLPTSKLMATLANWRIQPQWTSNPGALASIALKRLKDAGALNERSMTEALARHDLQTVRDLGVASTRYDVQMLARALQAELNWQRGRSAAAEYFAKSKDDRAEDFMWIGLAVDAGLDPNLRVRSTYYDEEGLLIAAVRENNVGAIKALLASGASPHAFQSLSGTRYSDTRFIIPTLTILKDNKLPNPQAVVTDLMRAGLVIPNLYGISNGFEPVLGAADRAAGEYAKAFGNSPQPTPTIDESPTDPICKAAQKRSRVDWCQFTRSLGEQVAFSAGIQGKYYSPVDGSGTAKLRYLLNISNDSAYFLASFPVSTLPNFRDYDYIVVEVPRTATDWRVYKYNYDNTAFDCKKDSDGREPMSCWVSYRAWPVGAVRAQPRSRANDAPSATLSKAADALYRFDVDGVSLQLPFDRANKALLSKGYKVTSPPPQSAVMDGSQTVSYLKGDANSLFHEIKVTRFGTEIVFIELLSLLDGVSDENLRDRDHYRKLAAQAKQFDGYRSDFSRLEIKDTTNERLGMSLRAEAKGSSWRASLYCGMRGHINRIVMMKRRDDESATEAAFLEGMWKLQQR